MTLEEIDQLIAKRDSLTSIELEELKKGIFNNSEAKDLAILGAIELSNFSLAISLIDKK